MGNWNDKQALLRRLLKIKPSGENNPNPSKLAPEVLQEISVGGNYLAASEYLDKKGPTRINQVAAHLDKVAAKDTKGSKFVVFEPDERDPARGFLGIMERDSSNKKITIFPGIRGTHKVLKDAMKYTGESTAEDKYGKSEVKYDKYPVRGDTWADTVQKAIQAGGKFYESSVPVSSESVITPQQWKHMGAMQNWWEERKRLEGEVRLDEVPDVNEDYDYPKEEPKPAAEAKTETKTEAPKETTKKKYTPSVEDVEDENYSYDDWLGAEEE